jgi:hypothetical protein
MDEKAHDLWQVAYVDSARTFKKPLEMKQNEILDILKSNQIDLEEEVRLAPVDPTKSISMSNYCLTTAVNKNDMCRVWRRLHCLRDYLLFISPESKRRVYASSV